MTGLDQTADPSALAQNETGPRRQVPLTPAAPAPKPGALRQFRHALLRSLFASSLYRLSLPRSGAARLAAQPADPWPGDPGIANAIFQGQYRFGGTEVQLVNQPPWSASPPAPEWAAEASGFSWLRHFRAGGGEAARQGARELVRSWIETNAEFDPLTWRPDVMGHRLMAWSSHADFLLDAADPPFRQSFLADLDRQARHLGRSWKLAPAGAERLAALAGLTLAAHTLDPAGPRARGLDPHLTAAIGEQVLADGGHASRNPSQHLAVLRDLIWLNAGLEAAGGPVPSAVIGAIERMAPMLAFFRHGDGRLALFNGAWEGEPEEIAATLDRAGHTKRPLATATHSGFERLAAGKALVIVDAGAPAPAPFDAQAHAGTLSFECSVAKQRMIVNCGHRGGHDWQQASRATAAHSTLSLGGTNSSEVLNDGLGNRPGQVRISRREDEGNLWLDAEHGGYVGRASLFHRRRFYLVADGTELRGEDVIEGSRAESRAGLGVTVRFHLHPDVQVSKTGEGALVKLPSGEGWQFRAAGASLSIEETVYLGVRGQIRRAEQIVLASEVQAAAATLHWALTRI